MSKKTVRAVDVGFGNTKFTTSDGIMDGEIGTQIFPSIALPATGQHLQAELDAKHTVQISVGKGQIFEVGESVASSMGTAFARQLDLKYSESAPYLALTLGAVHYMDVQSVDLLVVGLPVLNFNALAPALKEKLRRVHSLPRGKVEISDVLVVPQPVGGMYDFGVRNQIIRQLHGQNNLLIDPGFYTVDWVVTQGMTLNSARSGAATDAGMAAILRKTFNQITLQYQKTIRISDPSESDLIRLDQAIRLNQDFRLFGKPIPVNDFIHVRDEVIKGALHKLHASVGGSSDIDNVVIVGGGAAAYKDAVAAFFPNHDVRVAKDAAFSNVRGFQMMGNLKAGLLNAGVAATEAAEAI